MKSFSLFRQVRIFLFASLVFGCCASAQAAPTTVHVPAAGTLSSVSSSNNMDGYAVDSLVITGILNSDDFYYMRDHLWPLAYLDISGVTVEDNKIPSMAFRYKTSMKRVILPNGIETIGESAFDYCYPLENINIPASLQTIEAYAFRNCMQLTGPLLLPATLTFIGEAAFQDCRALKNINIPASLQSIENNIFSGCSQLTGPLTLPSTLTSIGSEAFKDCQALKSIDLPERLQFIRDNAFASCEALESIDFPEGLRSIDSCAFRSCTHLTGQLLLPSTLTSIGVSAFSNCIGLTSCKIMAQTPPSISNDPFDRTAIIYVPDLAAKTAYSNAPVWKDKIIIGDNQPVTLTLDIATPGTLEGQVLALFPSQEKTVNVLTLTGALNESDFNFIKTRMTGLISADLSGISNIELPGQLFYERRGLMNIQLPDGLKKIGYRCFQHCSALTAITFPASLEDINYGAFADCYALTSVDLSNCSLTEISYSSFSRCNSLQSVNFPVSLKAIGGYAFSECHSLEAANIPASVTDIQEYAFADCHALRQVSLPDHLTIINQRTFQGCSSLPEIQLPSKLTSIEYGAFQGCSKLNQITLPAGLKYLRGYSFQNCTGLQQVVCRMAAPSIVGGAFWGVDVSACELIVPEYSQTSYRLADTWQDFFPITPFSGTIDNIVVNNALTITGNVRPQGSPSVEIRSDGKLLVREGAPFPVSQFVMRENYDYNGSWGSDGRPQFISESDNMTAQQVKIDMHLYGNRWYYFSFPFDVAIDGIIADDGARYVFRYYDSASRAANGKGDSWKDVEATGTLLAGKGYIFQCDRDIEHLILPATGNTGNRLFASTAQQVDLTEYPSLNIPDQSWNLAGNPFACHYDIRCLDYTAPITVESSNWGGGYDAISPFDDAYILTPYQAFFVQKPAGLPAITFPVNGRQFENEPVRTFSMRSAGSRTLINLTVNNMDRSDKTRIVLNPNAAQAYEIECDAAKFKSMSPETPQLYSIDAANVQYAINERPLDNGLVALGFYAGKADNYTLALQAPVEGFQILLIDRDLNRTIDLATEEYTFAAEAGTFEQRFELRISANGNDYTALLTPEDSKTSVYAAHGAIVLENAAGPVSVYTLNGAQAASVQATGAKTVLPVPQGIYIVRTGGKVFKTIVF